MTFVVANGVRFHYQLDGDAGGPVLLLVHSLGTSLELWAPQLASFARSFRVLRFDARGHGKTDVPQGPYTIEQFAGDVVALLDALELERVDYCGVSLGGFVGQWLGANAPHRIRRLVLANTAARVGAPASWDARIATVRRDGLAAVADASLRRWFSREFRTREPAVAAAFRRILLATPTEGYIGTCGALRDMDLCALAPQIARPTLVVAGTADRVTPVEDASWLAANIPSATIEALPAAHLANVEAAEQFNDVVSAFLTSAEA